MQFVHSLFYLYNIMCFCLLKLCNKTEWRRSCFLSPGFCSAAAGRHMQRFLHQLVSYGYFICLCVCSDFSCAVIFTCICNCLDLITKQYMFTADCIIWIKRHSLTCWSFQLSYSGRFIVSAVSELLMLEWLPEMFKAH